MQMVLEPLLTVMMMRLENFLNGGFAGRTVGRASIVDADTMEIHGTRIRLSGIDAPV